LAASASWPRPIPQRLTLALEEKLAGKGVALGADQTLDPQTKATLAGEERPPDEGFDEASRTLDADDLREISQAQRPLPTPQERQILQQVVDEVSTRLLHNPDEALSWLRPGEMMAAPGAGQALTAAYFGNAVERAVAAELSARPELARFLHTPQRSGQPTPDIAGPIGPVGSRNYDVTTGHPRAVAQHNRRPYAPFTRLVTYPSLPQGWRFPLLDL
jgi:hypothetical protein